MPEESLGQCLSTDGDAERASPPPRAHREAESVGKGSAPGLGVLRGMRCDGHLVEELGVEAEKEVGDCRRPAWLFSLGPNGTLIFR